MDAGAATGEPTFGVSRSLAGASFDLLREHGRVIEVDLGPGASLAELGEVDALLTGHADPIGDEVLRAAPGLRCVCNVAVGYDNVDLDAAVRHGVAVTNTPGVLDDATADLAMTLMLVAARRVGEGERLIRSGRPWAVKMDFMLGAELAGKRLGIVGLGAIGTLVARRARAFGMSIAYFGRGEAPAAAELEAERQGLDDLLRESDFVSLHCPLTEATRNLIGARELALMKPSAVLINTARGGVLDEAALARALADGALRAAALDVYAEEPAVNPGLVELEQVVLTPHLGSATEETRAAMAALASWNAIRAVESAPLLTPVYDPRG
jgi:glyoxylate reductase